MDRESDKDGCCPLPISANLGFAVPVYANPPSLSDSVKFERDSCRIVPILPSGSDGVLGFSGYDKFEAPEYIWGNRNRGSVPESEPLDIQE
jgi:hypothetical protein